MLLTQWQALHPKSCSSLLHKYWYQRKIMKNKKNKHQMCTSLHACMHKSDVWNWAIDIRFFYVSTNMWLWAPPPNEPKIGPLNWHTRVECSDQVLKPYHYWKWFKISTAMWYNKEWVLFLLSSCCEFCVCRPQSFQIDSDPATCNSKLKWHQVHVQVKRIERTVRD